MKQILSTCNSREWRRLASLRSWNMLPFTNPRKDHSFRRGTEAGAFHFLTSSTNRRVSSNAVVLRASRILCGRAAHAARMVEGTCTCGQWQCLDPARICAMHEAISPQQIRKWIAFSSIFAVYHIAYCGEYLGAARPHFRQTASGMGVEGSCLGEGSPRRRKC